MYEGAYAQVNMTRPQSLAYALSDSPVGLLAWFVEKFRAWSDWDDNNEFPHGGHFAIHEQAPVLAHDIREFFRLLRPAH